MQDAFELYEFFVEGSAKRNRHVLLHISEPTIGERNKGYFFAICEMTSPTLAQVEHLQSLVDDIESGYYETHDDGNKSAFEITLEYMNKRSDTLLPANDKQALDLFVGVIKDDTLIFASHGNPHAFVVYKKNDRWGNIPLTQSHPKKDASLLFPHVTTGNIADGDYLFIASANCKDHFPHTRVEKIFDIHSTKKAALHIEKTLDGLSTADPFGGIILHKPEGHAVPEVGMNIKRTGKGSKESLDHLASQKTSTQETLSPPLFSTLKKTQKKQPFSPPTPPQRTPQRRGQKKTYNSTPEKMLVILGKALFFGISGILLVIKYIFFAIFHLFQSLFYIVSNYGNQRKYVIDRWKTWFQQKKQYITNLPIISKFFLIAIVVTVVGSSIAVTIKNRQTQSMQQKQEYHAQIQMIKEKQTDAESRLIYKDTQRASAILQEAHVLIERLEEHPYANATQIAILKEEVQSILYTLQKRKLVSAEHIATLPSKKVTQLAKVGNTLLAFGPEDDKLYITGIAGGDIQEQDHSPLGKFIESTTPKEADSVLFITSEEHLGSYDPDTGAITKKDITFVQDAKPTSATIYNRRIYMVDPETNQIYKHNPTHTGYDKGAAWLKEDMSFSHVRDIAIDGNVYVLFDGDIKKFEKGKLSAFALPALEPPLMDATEIWTYNDVSYVYVLEPAQKRVLVLTKDGGLIQQFFSPEWHNPTGMVVDEAKKQIYILDNGVISSFPIVFE